MFSFSKSLLLTISCCFFTAVILAQIPPGALGGSDYGSTTSPNTQQDEYVPEEIDTSGVFYFYADNPFQEIPFKDSLVEDFQNYDPVKKRDLEYANLGNVGSAHRPLFYQPLFHKGLDIGFHQFDLYLITPQTTPYYRIEKAFSRAYFTQGQDNQFLIFKGEFSQRFENGTNFSVDFTRMNHQGQYLSQRAKNTAFATSWWLPHKNGKYDGFLSFNSNTILQEDNGGIVPELVNDQNRVTTFSIPVQRNNQVANTQYVQREYTYTHYYKLNGERTKKKSVATRDTLPKDILNNSGLPDSLRAKFSGQADSLQMPFTIVTPDSLVQDSIVLDSLGLKNPFLMDSLNMNQVLIDSLKNPKTTRLDTIAPKPLDLPKGIKRAYLLSHQLSYKTSEYKFSDTNPDSNYYKNFTVHKVGLRHFIGYKKLENSFRISTEKARKDKGNIRSQKDWLEAGITHSLNRVNQEPSDTTLHNLFLHARWHFTPSEKLKVKTYAHYGLLANGGDYRINGDLFFDLDKIGSLEISAIHQRFAPSLIQSRLYISKLLVWENNFDKTFETTLSATYKLPFFRFEVTGKYHLVNNFIYFDTLGIPQQTRAVINIGQLILKKDFKLGAFHLYNTVIFQQSADEFLHLPQFYSKHSFFVQGKIFKKRLFTRFGADIRLNNSFQPDTYQAVIGQFHLQDEDTAMLYPALDIFLNFRVKTFRFFIKYENLINAFDQSRFYLLTANYPERYASLRFGVSWRFKN